jgi:hypothetical protein
VEQWIKRRSRGIHDAFIELGGRYKRILYWSLEK